MANENEDEARKAAKEAAEAAEAAANASNEAQGAEKPEKREEKTFTQEEVNRTVEARIAREREKWKAEAKAKEDAATEAERLKNMTELEKAQYEARRLKERNDQLEEAQNFAEQTSVARKSLAESGIEVGDDLLACIVSADADKTKAAIDEFKAVWAKALDEAVKGELSRKSPHLPDPSRTGESAGARYAKKVNDKYQRP